ncbi:MAG: FtsX-like permease family protein [Tissierellia bacterium]|nr:FtsX-like permease family protein [Tissierellia bacterium]
MKQSLIKDTFREIKNSLGRFLAIFAIVALGTGFFAGIKATAPDMKITGDKYFDDYRLMDFWLISTLGFNEKDIEEISKLENIEGIAPSYAMDAIFEDGDNEKVIRLISLPMDKIKTKSEHYINRVNLVEGRFPEKPGECLAERGKLGTSFIPLGEKIKLNSGTDEDILENLENNEYTVVGLVENPLYIAYERGTSTIGNGKINSFIMLPEEEFKLSVYTDVYLTIKGAREVLTFNEEYDDLLDPVKKDLETVGDLRKEGRYNEIKEEAKEKLEDAKKELREGEEKQAEELAKAEKELNEAKEEIAKGESELKDKEKEFNKTIKSAENKLREEENKLKTGEEEYNKNLKNFNEEKKSAQEKFKQAEIQVVNGEKELVTKEKELEQAKLGLNYITDENEKAKTLAIIEAGEKELAKGKQEIYFAKIELEKNKSDLEIGEQKLKDAKAEIDEGKIRLQRERVKLEDSKKTALKEFEKARKEIEDGKREYDKGYEEYLKGKKESDEEIADAKEKIRDGEEELRKLKKPKWYIVKRSQTRDFIEYEMAADRIDAVAQVFPVFFFLIAILVSLTTMTRMVDEERVYIGSLKAMGYRNIAIASKYIIYAAMASISGSIVGLFIGFWALPTVIFNAYRIMYIMPDIIIEYNSYYAILSTLVAVIATTSAALIAVYGELREVPANLLRPRAPKPGKRILLERIDFIWSKLKFSQKVTARNLFRYKRRLFMTIIGIAGCTALLVAGFGLKDSIMAITSKQFDEINKYEMVMDLKDGIGIGQSTKSIDTLEEDSRIEDYILIKEQIMDIGKGDLEETANIIVPEDINRLKDFIILRNRETGENLSIAEDGAILSEKAAKLLNVNIGDEIYIKDENDIKRMVRIIGITENYVNHYVYISPSLYEKVFEEDIEYKRILAKTTNTEKAFEDKLSKELLKNDDVSSIEFITGISKAFNNTLDSLDKVIMVLIVSAGALAFVVLYNLTNINISERIREIATIKVLGFYDEEVSKYVYRENRILTIMGTILGLGIGVFLHKFIILTTEIEFIMFGREIRNMSFLYSAILTLVFAAMVDFVMYFKLKRVDMVESLKSID